MPKLCEYRNCRERASYGYFYQTPERCKQHAENRKPQYKVCDCGKSYPNFNVKGKKAKYCGQCKTEGMEDVKSKRCFCGKALPSFNFKGKKANYCNQCKEEGMEDVKHERCFCGKARPNFNVKGKKAKYCSQCKTEGMENVVDKKCVCGKARPNFNVKGKKAKYCGQCKTEWMEDVKHKRCFCGKSYPSFNVNGKKGKYCGQCKTEGMENVANKRCFCGKSEPTFNVKGEKAKYCSQCKKDGMENVKSERCPNCIDWPDSQIGNKKYRGYCTRCFARVFPLDPLTFQIRTHNKEIATRDFINANYEGFQHDKPLFTGHCKCTHRRRIDHRILIGNTLLAVETDENQHKSYNEMDEESRYNDLFMAYSGKWIYIRFNPDRYMSIKGKRKNPTISTRLYRLKEEIDKQIERIKNEENTELVERVYLYYDDF